MSPYIAKCPRYVCVCACIFACTKHLQLDKIAAELKKMKHLYSYYQVKIMNGMTFGLCQVSDIIYIYQTSEPLSSDMIHHRKQV